MAEKEEKVKIFVIKNIIRSKTGNKLNDILESVEKGKDGPVCQFPADLFWYNTQGVDEDGVFTGIVKDPQVGDEIEYYPLTDDMPICD